VSPYGRSKLLAEAEALKWKDRFPLVILRPAAVYGPGDEDFLDFFRLIGRGILPLYGRRRKSLSVCAASDAVAAMVLAAGADVASGEVFNVAHPEPATWEELGGTAARILGRKAVRIRVPPWTAYAVCAVSDGLGRLRRRPTALNLSKYRDMLPDAWEADVTKARRVLGFEARVPLEEGLRETLGWYVRNGRL
jgi:nucleoside-diphosphate-sugar epimerase